MKNSLKKYKFPLIIFAVGALSFIAFFVLTPSPESKQPAGTADFTVNLQGGKALPDQVIVKVGQSVQFNSKDGKSHNLSLGEAHDHEDTAGTYQSGEFKADEAWKVSFKQAGSFTFHDENNPDISILVVAYNP